MSMAGSLTGDACKKSPVESGPGRALLSRWAGHGRERLAEASLYAGRSHPGLRPLANLSLRVGRLLPAVVWSLAPAWV